MIHKVIKTLIRTRNFNLVGECSIIEKGEFYHADGIKLGKGVYIGPKAQISANGGLEISDGTIIGPNVTIYTSNHNYDSEDLEAAPYDTKTIKKKVYIGKYVWIGGNTLILPGAKINDGCVIGAGETIRGEIPPYTVYVNGVAIRKRRHIERFEDLVLNDKIYMKEKMSKYGWLYKIKEKVYRIIK